MYLGNILVTGGFGFIGSHFIREILTSTAYEINSVVNIDYMGFGSNPNTLRDIDQDPKYRAIIADINDGDALSQIAESTKIDVIVNFAAESHVDRSIANPAAFIKSNINGVQSLLEFARINDVGTFVQISTDEVYGDATGKGHLNEEAPLYPNSPYSASKASADLLTRAYHKTYGLKTRITRCSNNFGPNQFPEKLIPKTIIRALNGLTIPIYGDGQQTREWLYVRDHVSAILQVIANGKPGEIYNISTSSEKSNIKLVEKILDILYKHRAIRAKIEHVPDRPGHDRRYSLDSSKISRELGWTPHFGFESALEETVEWYLKNDWWWTPLITKEILDPQPWKQNWKKG